MVKIESGSATSTPLWLILSCALFFAGRLLLTGFESISPPKASDEIRWRKPAAITEAERHSGKLFFYDFQADWCDPCRQMDKGCFLSRDIVKQLNSEFIPVRVSDMKRENGKNDAATQELEDSYNVMAFPTLVVAMPNGTKVSDHLGMATSQSLRTFLQEALTVAAYYKGKDEMIAGDCQGAAASFDEFLEKTNWQHWRSAYAAIFSSISHREIGEADKADAIIAKALTELHDHTFPYPVLVHLSGKQSFDELLKEASENKNNRILSYAYSGLDLYTRKNFKDALAKFEWVLANCDDKDSFESRVVNTWIERARIGVNVSLSRSKGQ